MKAFVTGATGFIGSNLVKRLLSDGWSVKVLVREHEGKLVQHDKLKVIKGTLADLDKIDQGTKDADVVFHLAAGLPYHNLSCDEYWKTNVEGTKNILIACKKNKVKRLVHVSTVGIYGASSDYSMSKAKAEELIRDYIRDFNLPVTIIRPTIGYGPGDTRPGFLNLFRLINKGLFIPVGNGENYFHTFYIDNLIDALLLASHEKSAEGQDFIIGDEVCPKMKDIVKAIYKAENKKLPKFNLPLPLATILSWVCDVFQYIGLPAPLTSKRLQFITENRKYDITKAKQVLKYKPKIDLEEGVRKTFLWYKENGYL